MFKIASAFAALAVSLVTIGTSHAQNAVGIGVNQTAIGQIGTAIASVVSQKTDVVMRPQTVAATEQYVPMVNANQIEFGIANTMQTLMSIRGEGISEGRPNPNLRIVAVLFPNFYAPLVQNESDITSVEDLRGQRVPSGWTAQEVGRYLLTALLANGGLTWDEVEQVPVAGFPQQYQAFQEGRVDVTTSIIGQGSVNELDSRVPVRFLSLNASEDAQKRMSDVIRGAYISEVSPRPGLVGVFEPINTMTLDFILFANADVSDELVYKVTKAIYESDEELRETGPLWRNFHPDGMAKQLDADFHPGAIRYFEEAGVWPAN